MLYPRFMDDQPTGRGVYVVRRILAILVVLLVLALLVPQAYQTLLGPRDETGSGMQDMADVGRYGKDGSHEDGGANGETARVADDLAEREDAYYNPLYSSETGVSDGAARTSRDLET